MGQNGITPFTSLLWQQEQRKLFSRSSQGARFHPAITLYCLSLTIKSPFVYEEIRNSQILRLPSMRTLRDYKHFFRRKVRFNKQVPEELLTTTEMLPIVLKIYMPLVDTCTCSVILPI